MKWSDDLLYAEQLRLEQAMHDGGAERYRKQQQRMHESGEASATSANRRLSKEFVEPLAEGIQAYIDHSRAKGGRVAQAVPFLECVPPDVEAFISIKTVLDHIPLDSTLQRMAVAIGQRIEDQARFTKLEEAAPKYIKAVYATLKRVHSRGYNHRRNVMAHAEDTLSQSKTGSYAVDIDRWAAWSEKDHVYIGMTLLDILMNTIQYDGDSVFVMYTRGKRDSHRLKVSSKVSEWSADFDEFMQYLAPEYSPCVIQPRGWKGPKCGGYYMPEVARTLPLVKTNRKAHLKRLTAEQMPEVYRAVNALQAVQWEINTDILDVAKAVRSADLGLGIPQADPYVPPEPPVRPELHNLRGKELAEAMTEDEMVEFNAWKNEARRVYERENTRSSKYMTVNRTLKAADQFSRYPCVYFVYTMDSRGRVYCRSSQFSPQGDDLQKALVRFHKAKPLGPRGRDWLAVQGANTWGEDKAAFADRIACIEDLEETIRDIAADPLTFREWANADEPWQFLAWAIEWNRLLEWEDAGKAAADFPSQIPVAQDGSCSGIQHYSAMLQDRRGGAEVNLTDNDKPQDIYRAVADVAARKMQDILAGDETLEVRSNKQEMPPHKVKEFCQAWLDMGISRSLTKRPVMILPYGGTMISTREYIEEYLNDLEADEAARAKATNRKANPSHPFGNNTDALPRTDAVAVCTKVVWQSIGEVVVAAKQGMGFIQKLTGYVAKENKAMHWTTPTGFIVEQCLYEMQAKRVKTKLLGGIEPTLAERTDDIDAHRMRSSSAPNFVHSLDASHLVKAVNRMQDEGIDSVAVVHDSFGTHAGDTDTLRKSLKDTFVEMYAEPVLEDLKDSAEDIISAEIDLEVPFIGSLELEETRDATYTFA